MTSDQQARLQRHLFPGDGLEAVALALCGRTRTSDRETLTVHEIVEIPLEDCRRRSDGVNWPTERLYALLERIAAENFAVLKVHSHPTGYDAFSVVDDKSDIELLSAVSRRCGGVHASAIMLPDGQLRLRALDAKGAFLAIDRMAVVGDNVAIKDAVWGPAGSGFDLRHRQMFGDHTTDLLSRLCVGIVGISGTGSPTVEMLARLGVGRLVLIDADNIELKNLNRIYGATRADIGKPKVNVLAEHVARMGLHTEVKSCAERLESERAAHLLASCDFVFGCMDSVGGRDMLARFAARLIIPYVDIGVRLDADGNGGVNSVSAAVHYLCPGGSSLKTRGVYSDEDVYAETLYETDPDFYADQVARGYIRGVRVDSPAVISINTAAAATAVNEFLARLHPFRTRPNAEFATQRILISHGRIATVPEGEADASLAKILGLGRSEISVKAAA